MESMSRRLALVDPAEEVRQMFKAFDRGCRGFITRDDLRQVCAEQGFFCLYEYSSGTDRCVVGAPARSNR